MDRSDKSLAGASGTQAATGEAFRIRIVAAAKESRVGKEFRVDDGVATIGRAPGNAVVLHDGSVSREHARITRVEEGYHVEDLGSANGIWTGGRRVRETTVDAGERLQVGSTVIECLGLHEEPADTDEPLAQDSTMMFDRGAFAAAEAEEPAEEEVAGLILRFTRSADESLSGTERTLEEDRAILGRGQDCTVTIDDGGVSRKHVRLERADDGILVTDLGSTNGTWIDDERITEPTRVQEGVPVRVGPATVVEARLPAVERAEEEAEEAAPDATIVAGLEDMDVPADGTVFIPAPDQLVDRTRPMEEEGELVEPRATEPFLADDPEQVWYVVSGGVELFTVALEGDRPKGPRKHFLGILPGQCFLGFDTAALGMSSGFLALAKPNTQLRKIPLERVRQLASAPERREAVAALVETWVNGLSRSLTQDIPRPERWSVDVRLRADEEITLGESEKAAAVDDLVWIPIWSGSHLLVDMSVPVFPGRTVLFPVSADSWIQPVGDEFAEHSMEPRATVDVIDEPRLWAGLAVFQETLCETEFINKKLAEVDEFIRLQDKAAHSEAAEKAAYDAIGSVLRTEAERPGRFMKGGATEPVVRACAVVGDYLDMEVRRHPGADDLVSFDEKIEATAQASGFRTRTIALRGEWWKKDSGPMVGALEETGKPVALLPAGPRSYECVDPETRESRLVDADMAAEISSFAHGLYRPFPEGELTAIDLIKFGARGLGGDFRTLLLMGIVIGVLGTLTPYFTGKVIDSAIPDSDTAGLMGLGMGLFGAAFGSFMFRITQAIATLRVQGKMEYSIQSALWDRLLDLPTSFFRDYSAGDLAERAMGIDRIQQLMSGAGIAAILGSMSGLAYVVMMMMYDFKLTLIAVGLTLFYVGTTMTGNYLQFRHQRHEVEHQGRISGLVLNLITGVTNIRVAGAEPHAFRTWAQQFSEQRKISFTIGQIQNFLTVFNGVYPLLSSIFLFLMMWYWQEQAAATGQTVLSTGEFIAFNAAYGLFLTAMQSLGEASMNMIRVGPYFERLQPIVTEEPEVDSGKVYPGELEGEIEVSHVHFRYDTDGPWVMKDLSLKIESGDFVAFVGGSGCGKSTLMRLLLGFEVPEMGSVLYDGQDLDSLDLRMVRQQMGVVLQQSRVLPTDIFRNIVGTSSRTEEEAWEAAEMAGLADDIRAMPMQMHTYVSEGGGTLSGGQRQRLMIARSLVNRPKIMFMDEATSALDNAAQARVTESIDRMGATRIVIAHRLSTVINADKICYLEGGRVAEEGTYEELMELDGMFAELARRQMS